MRRTRDLLGGNSQTEIDLDAGLPPPLLSLSGWERRLDMKSGKVYYGTANSAESSVQDLNFPPTSSVSVRGREMEKDKERKMEKEEELRGSVEEHDFMGREGDGESGEAHAECQSVCTLDKVKIALQRAAEKQSGKRKGGDSEEALQFYTSCSSEVEDCSLLAAGCPRCLLYVLLPRSNPKCPRCACSVLDITNTSTISSSSSSAKRSRLCHTDGDANHRSDAASPPFLFDLNSPV